MRRLEPRRGTWNNEEKQLEDGWKKEEEDDEKALNESDGGTVNPFEKDTRTHRDITIRMKLMALI